MFAREFFVSVARPLFDRHQATPDAEELIWASVVSLNHVADYGRRDGVLFCNNASLDTLATIANAFKHARPQRSGLRVDPKSLSNNFLAIPDVIVEPNIFASWTVEISGKTCSIGSVLRMVVDFWSKELDADTKTQG